jgi:hypothetical protein
MLQARFKLRFARKGARDAAVHLALQLNFADRGIQIPRKARSRRAVPLLLWPDRLLQGAARSRDSGGSRKAPLGEAIAIVLARTHTSPKTPRHR